MAWVLEKLILITVEACMLALTMLAEKMQNVFGLSGTDTLDFFFDTFREAPKQMYRMFLIIAFGILFIAMIYQIFKAFFGPLTEAEPPSRVVIRTAFFALLVANSQYVVAFVLEIATIPYKAIAFDGDSMAGLMDANWSDAIASLDLSAGDIAGDYIQQTAIGGVGWINCLILIVLYTMLLKQFIQLLLEIAERYVVIALLTIVAPLCIACGAIKGVSEVFKNWMSFLINGCIVLIFSTFFISVFFAGFVPTDDYMQLMLYICWIKTGMKIDEHMNALGLKTAKTGGFGADLMTAMHATAPKVAPLLNKTLGMNIGGGKGFRDSLGLADRAQGKDKASQKSIVGALMRTKKGQQMVDKADSAVRKAGAKLNNSNILKAAGIGSGDSGKNTNMSYDQMNAWKMGKANDVSPSMRNAFNRDMAEKELGSDFMKKMDAKGMRLDDVSRDKEGNAVFKFSDKDGNSVGVKTVENPDPEKNLSTITGDDGRERGIVAAANVDGQSADLSALGLHPVDEDAAGQSMAALDKDSLQESGLSQEAPDVAQGGIESSSGTIDNTEGYKMDDNGNMVHCEADEEGTHMAIRDEDGNVMGYVSNEEAAEQAERNGVEFADGAVGKPDESARYSMDENGNVTKDADGNLMAVSMADGSTQYRPEEEVNAARPVADTPEAYSVAGVAATVSGAETYNMNANGEMERAEDGTGQYVKGNINGQEAYLDKGQMATNVDGSKTYSMNADGKMQEMSNGQGEYVKGEVGGQETYFNKAQVASDIDTSKTYNMAADGTMLETKGNNGDYVKGNIGGQEAYINKDAANNAISNNGSFANSFNKVGDSMVQAQRGDYNLAQNGQFMTSQQISDGLQSARPIVATESGGLMVASDGIRRDEMGRPASDGEYMYGRRENGTPILSHVQTDSRGDVVTYSAPRAKEYECNYNQESAVSAYTPTNNVGNADAFVRNSQVHSIPQEEKVSLLNSSNEVTGTAWQQYVRTSDGNGGYKEMAVDMNHASLGSNGEVVAGKDNTIPVMGAHGETRNIPVNDLYDGDGKTGSNDFRSYVHARSTDNAEINSMEYNRGSMQFLSSSSSQYVNDVPTKINPMDYRMYDSPMGDTGYSAGQKIAVNQENGQAIMLTPMDAKGYDFSSASGAPVNINGNNYFAESLSAPAMGSVIKGMGFNPTVQGTYSITDKNDVMALRAMCGGAISDKATDISVSVSKSGFMSISFKEKGEQIVISNSGSGEKIFAPTRGADGKTGKKITLGFKSVVKQGETVKVTKGYNKSLSNVRNKGFRVKNKKR